MVCPILFYLPKFFEIRTTIVTHERNITINCANILFPEAVGMIKDDNNNNSGMVGAQLLNASAVENMFPSRWSERRVIQKQEKIRDTPLEWK